MTRRNLIKGVIASFFILPTALLYERQWVKQVIWTPKQPIETDWIKTPIRPNLISGGIPDGSYSVMINYPNSIFASVKVKETQEGKQELVLVKGFYHPVI